VAALADVHAVARRRVRAVGGAVVFDIAYPAFVPTVVDRDRLVPANGALEAGANGARLLGTNSGGLLAQIAGPPVALLADAATFVVSAATITAMAVREPPRRRPPALRCAGTSPRASG